MNPKTGAMAVIAAWCLVVLCCSASAFAAPLTESPEKFRVLALEEKRILERAVLEHDARLLELKRDLLLLKEQQEWAMLREERIRDLKDMTPYELREHIRNNALKIDAATMEISRLDALTAEHLEKLEALNSQVIKRFGTGPLEWWSIHPDVVEMMSPEKPVAIMKRAESMKDEKTDLTRELRERGLDEWLRLQEVEGGILAKSVKPILFASGKTEVQPGYDSFLKNLAEYVTPVYGRVQLEGYADNARIKSKAFPSNWELAAQRASSVAARLTMYGVPASNITVISRGSSGAPMPNNSSMNQALNRRVDITVFIPGVMEK